VRFSDGRLSGFPWFMAAAVTLAVAQSLRAYFAGADLVLGPNPRAAHRPDRRSLA